MDAPRGHTRPTDTADLAGAGARLSGIRGACGRVIAVVAAVVVTLMAAVPLALAAPAIVTIDDDEPELAQADDGGWTADLGFTNLTDGPVGLDVAAAGSKPGCDPSLDASELAPAEHTDVELSLPAGCAAEKQRVTVTVTTDPPGTTPFQISATPAKDPAPDWEHLLAFLVGAVAAAVLLAVTYLTWKPPAVATVQGTSTGRPPIAKPGWRGALPHLPATYSFKDSWVTNIAAAGALLTGVFGSADVVKAVAGEDAEKAIGLATVGAAIAAALIAAGTIVPLAAKGSDGKSFTVIGVVLGATLTLAGAAGELYLLTVTGVELDLGWLKWVFVPVAGVLGLVLLGAYARTALRATLNQGVVKPPDEPSDAIEAAELIVAALSAKADIDAPAMRTAIEEVTSRYPRIGTSAGDETFSRRHAAAF